MANERLIARDELDLKKAHLGQYHEKNKFFCIFDLEHHISNNFMRIFSLEIGFHIAFLFFLLTLFFQYYDSTLFLNYYSEFNLKQWIIRAVLILSSYFFGLLSIYQFDESTKYKANYMKILLHFLYVFDIVIIVINFTNDFNSCFSSIKLFGYYLMNISSYYAITLVLFVLTAILYLAIVTYFNWIIYCFVVCIEKEQVYVIKGLLDDDDFRVQGEYNLLDN